FRTPRGKTLAKVWELSRSTCRFRQTGLDALRLRCARIASADAKKRGCEPALALFFRYLEAHTLRHSNMTGAEFLLRCFRDQGLEHVFLVPGGHIDPLVAELGKGAGLQAIVAAHEEGAGFMADGYARVGGRFGVCMCIGGPGAGNILPAAIAARSDRSRVLFLTGDVPTTLQGRGAFQDGSMEGTRDTELLSLTTAFSEEVELISQFPRQLAAAFRAMGGCPPGPV